MDCCSSEEDGEMAERHNASPRRTRGWLLASAVLAGCACGTGLPDFTITPCAPGAATHWAVTENGNSFSKAEGLVDPAATPLIGKIRVGQVVELEVQQRGGDGGDTCAAPSSASVTWTSTAPQVASLQAKGSRTAALAGLAGGDTAVSATVDGARADLYFICCNSNCVSPPPLPTCQYVPIAAVRVVP
jgi:hypothetical protein